ncbi:MAG: nucleotidyltransferase domain-containing protein [Deltaproteobacteria bacterium]|nr:nucleotidyltransferase domain-containing protein [Deltaproteobacteria bacterium]
MPVKFLNSSVLKWPDRATVDRAARSWADREARKHPELLRLGYFGSYARGDAGVGSDLDVVAIVDHASEPFERRSLTWNLNALPVPAELIVYTQEEWKRLQNQGERFARMLKSQVVWIYPHES